MSKRTPNKSKPATTGAHPELKRSPAKPGAPGTESSKSAHSETDERSGHDKDGNSQQRTR